MSIIVILYEVRNTIYFEFYENNPTLVSSLYIFMLIFVKISYTYTYLNVPTSKYFSFGDNETYFTSSL